MGVAGFSAQELEEIAQNRYRLVGFSADDTGFDPDEHKGEVVIATMHKAKGLEWDRVYLLSRQQLQLPLPPRRVTAICPEKWFIRDRLNLEAELIAQLKALVKNDRIALHMAEGQATNRRPPGLTPPNGCASYTSASRVPARSW